VRDGGRIASRVRSPAHRQQGVLGADKAGVTSQLNQKVSELEQQGAVQISFDASRREIQEFQHVSVFEALRASGCKSLTAGETLVGLSYPLRRSRSNLRMQIAAISTVWCSRPFASLYRPVHSSPQDHNGMAFLEL
jgi:hypothetical protein